VTASCDKLWRVAVTGCDRWLRQPVVQGRRYSAVLRAHAYPMLQRKDSSPRRHTPAIFVFDEPACGPVLIGAGRFLGMDLQVIQ
jgi:hypothetical protein